MVVTWAPAPHWQTQPQALPSTNLNAGGAPSGWGNNPWERGPDNQAPGDRIFDAFTPNSNAAWLNVYEPTVLGTIDTFGAAGQGTGFLADLAIRGSLPAFELPAAQEADKSLFNYGSKWDVDRKFLLAESNLEDYPTTVIAPLLKNLPKA